MTCPKCGAPMRSYERNGITIDQCNECRGIFLDRGELDRLIDAESNSFGDAERDYPPQQPAYRDDRGYRRDDDYYRHKKRKRGFLGELFDD